ncbi:hypothetical protein Q4F19_17905 [Sphingomonas sp. BIUV-7]|uniref:Uncharacterized protein n=1 Tax=Sphingomonas natans TaxID=3063330 RepID=A0ABT8YF76_9SPHN|nr:hypothetical protein [Sphingomonas sp. BIUV-7]MDO6416265.1 hypothetical protein [Sphingomonas sp. BIUV-7]
MAEEKSNISYYHFLRNKKKANRQRLGPLAPVAGFILIIGFALFLIPLFIYMLFFNRVYFWVRNQHRIIRKPYYNYDRHRIAHLGLMDKLWCEYCEWANGSLQWIIDVVNEIERRYCPIKNQCDPHCSKAKAWRSEFLPHDHTLPDLKQYLNDGGYEAVSVAEKKEL